MRSTSLFATMACLACASTSSQPAVSQSTSLSYEPILVTLRGTLTNVTKYGPPNYGENPATDQKLIVPILVLDQAVNVRGDSASETNRESFNNVKEIQLLFGADEAGHRKLTNQRIVVTGALSRAISGHHFTDVVLTVQSIRRAN